MIIGDRAPFRDLPVGVAFTFNGNRYVKQSTRTARLTINDRVFYFGNAEVVRIARPTA